MNLSFSKTKIHYEFQNLLNNILYSINIQKIYMHYPFIMDAKNITVICIIIVITYPYFVILTSKKETV